MTGKKIAGIGLSVLGGIATIVFGSFALTVLQRLYLTRADAATSVAYGLTAVTVAILGCGHLFSRD